MTPYDPYTERTLRAALLMSDPSAVRAYTNNAEFHATIHLIVKMWPTILDTLVESAEKQDAMMKEQVRLLSMGPEHAPPI